MAADVLWAKYIAHPENRIIGGSNTAIETAPWQVSLQGKNKTAEYNHICGGSLIRPDIVLTAGHCVIYQPPEILRVRVGSSNKNIGGQLIPVAKIVIHEDIYINHLRNLSLHDVAVLQLRYPVKIGPSAQTIALAEYEPPVGVKALTTGWGKMSNGHKAIILQGVNLPILPHSICITRPAANDGNICAGLGDTGACFEDSGGPLVVNKRLVGIVSGGSYTCDSVTIFVSVPLYHQWILNAIDNLL